MIGVGSYNDIALFDDFAEGAGGTGIFNDVKNTRFSSLSKSGRRYIEH